jgi:hypothetical protein
MVTNKVLALLCLMSQRTLKEAGLRLTRLSYLSV